MMIPTLAVENQKILDQEQKIFALRKFISENPFFNLQDLYRWLYYGEFGPQDHVYYYKSKYKSELMKILDDYRIENGRRFRVMDKLVSRINSWKFDYSSPQDINPKGGRLWEPMGLSQRFIMVFVSEYASRRYPLKNLVDLKDRSPAFAGTRMQFKLDWGFIKDYILRNEERFIKEDFYGFEDRINFHQLPDDVPFTDKFLEARPLRYRVVPRKLFFEQYPEFDTKEDILPVKPRDSLID